MVVEEITTIWSYTDASFCRTFRLVSFFFISDGISAASRSFILLPR